MADSLKIIDGYAVSWQEWILGKKLQDLDINGNYKVSDIYRYYSFQFYNQNQNQKLNKMGKIEQQTNTIDTKTVQMDFEKEIEHVYEKFNDEIARLMGPELKQCVDKNSDDPRKIINCYDEFHKRISPTLAKLGLLKTQYTSGLQKCLDSKENAKICARIGLEKSNEYINEAFNDLKSYLA